MTESDAAAVEARVRAYYDAGVQAFRTADPIGMREYFDVPSMVLRQTATPLVCSTIEELDARWRTTIAGLPADYDHSVCHSIEVQIINPATAIATASGSRYRANGEEIRRVDASYVLTKTSGDWRVAVTIPH